MADLREGYEYDSLYAAADSKGEGGLAGGHERQPRVGGSLRFGEQLHRTGTDPDPRHDMRALQGEPQLRLHTILASFISR